MARTPRIVVPGGWYHITGRGIERRPIFKDDRDRLHFLELLAELTERFRLHGHAYVLMENHYHLLAELPEPNLSKEGRDVVYDLILLKNPLWSRSDTSKHHEKVPPASKTSLISNPSANNFDRYGIFKNRGFSGRITIYQMTECQTSIFADARSPRKTVVVYRILAAILPTIPPVRVSMFQCKRTLPRVTAQLQRSAT